MCRHLFLWILSWARVGGSHRSIRLMGCQPRCVTSSVPTSWVALMMMLAQCLEWLLLHVLAADARPCLAKWRGTCDVVRAWVM